VSREGELRTIVNAQARQIASLRREVRVLTKYVDTVSSPLWKRLIWWAEGFYFRKVGRWYAPGWTPRWPR
jgi:hypothetical protein